MRTDRHTEMNLIIAFRNFVNAPMNTRQELVLATVYGQSRLSVICIKLDFIVCYLSKTSRTQVLYSDLFLRHREAW